MNVKFSQRTDWLTTTNPLTQGIEDKREEGASLIDLTESNPTRCAFSFSDESRLKSFQDIRNLSYEPDARGLLEARKAVCAYYAEKKINVRPEQVFLTSSTSEAYSFIFRLLCDPRDLVVIPRPSYPLLDYLTALADVDTLRYFLSYEKDSWCISPDSLKIPFIEKPKALVIVNPNNPTGNFLKSDELEPINEMCQKSGTAIISDEVFLDFAFDTKSAKPMSLAQNKETLTFTLSGISKILAMPQMKISWIVVSGPEELKRKAFERLEIITDTYLSVNTPSQHALSRWLEERREVREEMKDRMLSNREYLETIFKNKTNVRILTGEGGWYSVFELDSKKSDEDAALYLLEKQGIIVYPGYFFDFAEGNFLVLSLLLPEKVFREGADRLLKGLEKII